MKIHFNLLLLRGPGVTHYIKQTSKIQNFNFNTSSFKSKHPRILRQARFISISPVHLKPLRFRVVQVFYRHLSELSKYGNQRSEVVQIRPLPTASLEVQVSRVLPKQQHGRSKNNPHAS